MTPSPPARDHVVVVGAGAFGGWTALALLRAGHRVTLVDAWGPGHSRASSGGETRVIRAVYGGVAIYSEMVARALALWREAERRWQRQVLVPTGSIWLCASDDSYVRRSIDPVREAGLSVEEWTPRDASRRYPQMRFDDARTVFFERSAGFLTARVACQLVYDSFIAEGGQTASGWARVTETTNDRLTSIRLDTGHTLSADRFVFACGPWMSQVFPDVIGRRIVATRQEVFFFGTPAGDTRFTAPELPVWVHLSDRIVYGTPVHDHRGLKVADDSAGDEVNPTTLDRAPTAAGLLRAREILRARFPSLADAPLIEARVCQYETSTDGHFLIDRHPHLENTWLVGGGSGHGFKMGPALGEYAASVVRQERQPDALFRYQRLTPRPR